MAVVMRTEILDDSKQCNSTLKEQRTSIVVTFYIVISLASLYYLTRVERLISSILW